MTTWTKRGCAGLALLALLATTAMADGPRTRRESSKAERIRQIDAARDPLRPPVGARDGDATYLLSPPDNRTAGGTDERTDVKIIDDPYMGPGDISPGPMLFYHPERQDEIGIRTEVLSPGCTRGDCSSWLSTRSRQYHKIDRMAASFVAQRDETHVAIVFSAEAYVNQADGRMFVRAILDGQPANPEDVVFVTGYYEGTRSFVFTAVVDEGVHSVEMQWLVDDPAEGFLKDASLTVRAGLEEVPPGSGVPTLVVKTPESGPNLEVDQQAWTNVPDMSLNFFVADPDAVTTVTFSAEALSTGGDRLFVRALVDGAPAQPSDMIFATGGLGRSRMASFGIEGLAPGWHDVRIQWLVDAGGTGTMGDRSLVVASAQSSRLGGPASVADHVFEWADGAAVDTSSTAWSTIPGMSTTAFVAENGEITVFFSAETTLQDFNEMDVRLVVDGVPADTSSVRFSTGETQLGTKSFVFDSKHHYAVGNGVARTIALEWRTVGAGQTATMGDRTMLVVTERGAIPDIAESPPIASGNRPLEPAIGVTPVLTILFDGLRPAPDNETPTKEAVEAAMFGGHGTVEDYFLVTSGGRFTISNAGFLGWYTADKPASHYWDGHVDCDDPASDGFVGGHAERWAEAITKADADFDFAPWDRDGDGVLQPDELTIQIVTVQDKPWGKNNGMDVYCNGASFIVDGVRIQGNAEWFTDNPAADMPTSPHELAHQILNVDDLYSFEEKPDPQIRTDTEPGRLSLMGNVCWDAMCEVTAWMDPMNRIALGWARPKEATESGWYQLKDVRSSEDVLVLPRRETDGHHEYFLLETRLSESDDPGYDEKIFAGGIAVWQIVEDSALNANPPACMTQAEWDAQVGNGNARRGIRLIRPTVTFNSSWAAWDAVRYDLVDNGLICDSNGDEATDRRNVLTWAAPEGLIDPSGYSVIQWSAEGDPMTFFVTVP